MKYSTQYCLTVVLLLIITTNCLEDKIKYYENLISHNSEKIKNYKLPTRNEEFSAGYQSDKILDFGELNYDFIVIGTGTAGSVVIKRLSEIKKWKILALEAGSDETDFSDIPLYSLTMEYTEKNWGYLTVPQNNSCLGMVDHRCVCPRGKSIGGSNTINGMAYVRGNPADFDNWEKIGNPGWGYKSILKYFIKSENSQIDGDPGYHGQLGIWNVEYPKPLSHIYNNFIEAHTELNISYIADYNGAHQIGCSRMQYNMVNGKRMTTAKSFLTYSDSKSQVTVSKKSLVTKIIIDDNNVAKGVIFIHNNKKYRAFATKEVIVSGGAINSPQLLMLSGIGPKKHLEEKKIKVKADLPVGQNLAEHPYFLGSRFHVNWTEPDYSMEEQIKQYLNGVGPLTFAFNMHGVGFMPTKIGQPNVPDIEYIFVPPNGTLPEYSKYFNLNQEITEQYVNKLNPRTHIVFYLALLHQKSRGSVTLHSDNPLDFPNIDFNMFSDPKNEDIEMMREGIKFLFKLIKTKPFQRINTTFIDLPICKHLEKYSDNFWECALRQMTTTIYHPTGTTQMGPRGNSVVDSTLKVYDIKNLRVVDAGVIPCPVAGHTNAPAAMVAEKAADMIKQEHGEKTTE